MTDQRSTQINGGEEMGMTDAQFKTHLLEQLNHWQKVFDMAKAINASDIMAEAKQQIDMINTALKF